MNTAINFFDCNELNSQTIPPHYSPAPILKFSTKNERKILQAFLLGGIHQLFCDLFQNQMQHNLNSSLECYSMDNKIIQLLIHDIVETGEYTLEGIAYYTHIPLDVIYDAACGINLELSITPWAKVVDLYMQAQIRVKYHATA